MHQGSPVIEILTPEMTGTSGQTLVASVVITNDGPDPTSYRIRVLGAAVESARPVSGGAVDPGGAVQVDVPIVVPETLGVGRHVVGLEVSSDRPRDKPALARLVIEIASVRHVKLATKPLVVRGFRSARFELLVENSEPVRVPLRLRGGARDVTVRFRPESFELEPGQMKRVKGRFRGAFRWSGEPVQHLVPIEAQGPSRSTHATVRYVQRSPIGWQVRRFGLIALVLALLCGAGLVAFNWWSERSDELANGSADTAVDGSTPDSGASGGSGEPSDSGGSDGTDSGSGGGGAGADDASDDAAAPITSTAFYGAVTTIDGSDATGVVVRARPLSLAERADTPTGAAGFAGAWATPRIGKIWPARYEATSSAVVSATRQTETVEPLATQTSDGGVWKLEGIGLRQTWEVEFSLPGYDTQRLVVTPPDDGERVEINPELVASIGQISGTVSSGGVALSDVEVTATDGTVSITTRTTASGDYQLTALNTPADYTLVFSRAGFSDSVLQVALSAGAALGGQDVSLLEGLGSVSGTVRASSGGVTAPLGGAVVVATLGDQEYRTTTLTSGAEGFYNLPGLPVSPNEPYTIRVESPKFTTETQSTVVAGSVRDVDFILTELTGGIAGIVVDENRVGIPAALVTLRRDDLQFGKSTVGRDSVDAAVPTGSGVIVQGASALRPTASAPGVGSFVFENVPPGEYTVTIEHYRYELQSFSVEITSGGVQWFPAGERTTSFPDGPPIVMVEMPLEGELTERIRFRAVEAIGSVGTGDSDGEELFGVTYTVESPQLDAPIVLSPVVGTDGEPGGVRDVDLAIGSYRVRAEISSHFTVTSTVVVASDTESYTFRMAPKGSVSVLVLDGITGAPIDNENWDLELSLVGSSVTEPGSVEAGTSTWSSESSEVAAGDWIVEVLQHPTGYRILPQVLIDTDDPTREVSTDPLRFTIDPTVGGNLSFSVVAERLPDLTVRLLDPVPAGPNDAPTLELFDVVDAERVTVSITCLDPDDASGAITQDLIVVDELGKGIHQLSFGRGVGADALDSDGDGEFGACQLATDGAETVGSVDLAPFDVDLSMGSSGEYHRKVAAVLLPEQHTVTATVQWRPDPGQPPEDLSGVVVTAADIIEGYGISSTLSDTVVDPQPTVRPTSTFTPDPDGRFTLDLQRAGVSVYTVGSDETNDASFTLTVPAGPGGPLGGETGLSTSTGPLDDPANLFFDYSILHEDPLPGVISGCIAVDSEPSVDSADVTVSATPSGPGAINPNPITNDTTADTALTCSTQLLGGGGSTPQLITFTIDPASAGYWDVDVTAPDHWRRITTTGTDLDVPFVLQPGATVDDLALRYVVDAQVELSVAVDTGAGLDPVAATARIERVSDDVVVIADTSVTSLDTLLSPVPVDDTTPLTPIDYRLELEDLPGFDLASATITIASRTDSGTDGGTTVVGDASAITFSVAAGQFRDIQVVLEPFGSIGGTIDNELWSDDPDTTADEAEYGPIVDVASARVYFCRVSTPSSSGPIDPSSPSEPDLTGTNPSCGSTGVVDNGGTYEYRFSGLAGWYRIWVVHPQYQEREPHIVEVTGALRYRDIDDPTRDAYRMTNDVDRTFDTPFVIEPLRGDITIDVLQRVTVEPDPPAYATGAQVSIRRAGAPPHDGTVILKSDDASYSDASSATDGEWALNDPDGTRRYVDVGTETINLTGLRPGTYLIDVIDPGSNHYPVTIQVTLAQSADADQRAVVVTAYAPARGASIRATVHVVNSTWLPGDPYSIDRSASLPPSGLTATHTFQAPSAVVTEGTSASSLVPNRQIVTEDVSPVPGTPPADSAIATSATIDIANAAEGGHIVGLGDLPDGYRLVESPGEITVSQTDVASDAEVAAQFVIVADDVDVTIDPRDDITTSDVFATIPTYITVEAATLTYEWPGGSELLVAQGSTRETDGTIVFADVPARPRFTTPDTTAGYTATVDTEYHAAGSTSFNLDPEAQGVTGDSSTGFATAVGVALTGDRGEVVLPAFRRDTPTTTDPLPGGTELAIWDGTNQLVAGTDFVGSYDGSAREYSFVSSVSRTVQVRAAVASSETPGPYVSDSVDVEVVLGRSSTEATSLELLKRPTLIVNIASPPSGVAITASPQSGDVVTAFPSGSGSWTLRLSPGVRYDVTIDAGPNYFGDSYSTPSAGYAIGETASITATLPVRSINVAITRNGDLTSSLSATVTASIGGVTVASGTATFAADAASASVTLPTVGLIPVDGSLDLEIAAPGYRTRTVSSPVAATATSPEESVSTAIFQLAAVSGSVTGSTDPAGSIVTATRRGSSPTVQYTAVVGSDGTYTFGNVFDVGTWDVFVAKTGTGADSGSFTVTDTNVASADFTRVSTIRLTADLALSQRTIAFVISVVDEQGTVVTDATVSLATATESGLTYSLTISAPGKFTRSYTVDLSTPDGSNTTTVLDDPGFITVNRTVTIYDAPVATGTVSGGDSADQLNQVVLYQAECSVVAVSTTSPTSPVIGRIDISGGPTWSTSQAEHVISQPDTYCVVALDKNGNEYDPLGWVEITYALGGGGSPVRTVTQPSPATPWTVTVDP
jgi:phage gp45-like